MVNIIDNFPTDEKIDRIKALDNMVNYQRPTHISLGSVCGEIKYAKNADELYLTVGKDVGYAPTIKELMALRIQSFNELLSEFPKLLYNTLDEYDAIRKMFREDNSRFGIWKERLTSSTNMVRIGNPEAGHLYFVDFLPDSFEDISKSIRDGNISDGGFRYSQQAIDKIVSETGDERRLSWKDYADSKGGNFSGIEWLNHPVFNAAVGDKNIMLNYVLALSTFRSLQLISQPNSGWCPREMKSGYGRPISLGFGADAFYPPNNTTVSHAMLLIRK